MTAEQAKLKALALEVDSNRISELDMITIFTNLGLPQEIIIKLQDIYRFTKELAGQTIHIGRIIITKLIEFVKQNPNLSIGLLVGIGLSVLVGMLSASIPIIGTVLSPIVSSIIAIIIIPLGALRGHRLDKAINGEITKDSLIEDMITISKRFWALFVDIFNSLKDYLN